MSHLAMDNLSSPDARGKRIRFIREHLLFLTREDFCQNSMITTQSLKGWELAWGGGLSPQGAVKIINHVKKLHIYCSESWLMHGIGRSATPITKDLDIHEDDERHIAKELLLFRELPDSIDTIIQDDGMFPMLHPGNYVGGIMAKDTARAIGKECIIITDNNEVWVRVLKYGQDAHRYDLVCLNERSLFVKKEIKNTAIQFAAPIIWIRRVFQREA